MRNWLPIIVAVVLGGLAPPADAAQRTELIPFLHMDAEVGYQGGIQFGRLREQTDELLYRDVARYNHSSHGLGVDIEFGVCPMLELDIELPIVLQDRYHFRSANDWDYDPTNGRVTMLDNEPVPSDELPDVKRAGFGDMWIALQFSPFNETYDRPSPATMLFDFGISPPTGKTLYDVNSRGVAGPGSGGTDLRVTAAFSKRVHGGEPYLWTQYVMTGRHEINLVDDEGQPVYEGGATLNPADEVHVDFGVELYAMHNPASDAGINVDLFGGFSYFTWADVEAGTLLPFTHPETSGHVATTAEYLEPHFGLGLYIRPAKQVQIRLNTGVAYETGHIVERVDTRNYEISTGVDTIRVDFGLIVVGSFARPRKPSVSGGAGSPIP